MIGFHYFSDMQHYRQQDLARWLPCLQALRARWLVLLAPASRAIPETFIKTLLDAEIQPVLHFHLQPEKLPTKADLEPLFRVYRRWGVRHAALFDRPNQLATWQAANWVQADLVERFLDLYLPLATLSLNTGLTPILPPLEPGGDYWDTAFLRRTLEGIWRRGHNTLLERMILGGYAQPADRPLQWGAGGPERWPSARPYFTPPGSEDQRGFRIFDWYAAISQAVLGKSLPMFLFGLGYQAGVDEYAQKNLLIYRLMNGESIPEVEAIHPQVIGGAFAPLVAPDSAPDSVEGWFKPDGAYQPQAESVLQWIGEPPAKTEQFQASARVIRHYLLLPAYEWGISDYHLDLIRPIVKEHQPTIGFSIEEAQTARRVTVVGGERDFPKQRLNQLRAAGIFVERLQVDGAHGIDIAPSDSEPNSQPEN